MKPLDKECTCSNCEGIFPIINRPGDSEAILKCKDCGKLWYSLIYERMSFSDNKDIFEEYQIPITPDEFHKIKETKYEDLNLEFLADRKARVIHEGGIFEIDSYFALRRCGR
ncbi:MAG: hypothetical protein ACFFD2_27240 [Promethearchaeota archaeon]